MVHHDRSRVNTFSRVISSPLLLNVLLAKHGFSCYYLSMTDDELNILETKCYVEWEGEESENASLCEIINARGKAGQAFLSIEEQDGSGVANGLLVFVANLGETDNPFSAGEAWTLANERKLPGLVALTQADGFSVVAIVSSNIKGTKERRYKAIGELVLRRYERKFEGEEKLNYTLVNIGYGVDLSPTRLVETFVDSFYISEDEIEKAEEQKQRAYGLPDTIDVNIDRRYPGNDAKRIYRTTYALADEDQLVENCFARYPDINATDGLKANKEHKKDMSPLVLKVYNPPAESSWPDKTKRSKANSEDVVVSIRKSNRNIRWFIESCMCLEGVHDLMTKSEYLYDKKAKRVHFGTQLEISLISTMLEEYTGWSDCSARVAKCVQSMIAENPVHPFLNSLPEWDKHDHIGDLIDTIKLPSDWDPGDITLEGNIPLLTEKNKKLTARSYVRIILETWLRCCVQRVQKHVDPSSDFTYPVNHVPIFVGPQGCFKNTWIRNLCFVDGMLQEKGYINPFSKDDASIFLNCVVCHLDEIDSNTMRYTDMSALKQLISKTSFEYRAPYDRRATVCVNQCSFIGSTNKDVFLSDETGNRRFFIIPVTGFDIKTKINFPQVWAQARFEAKMGFPLFVPRVLEKANAKANEDITSYGIAPALADLLGIARSSDEADIRFTSVANMFAIAYKTAFGTFDPKAMTNEALNKFSALLKKKLGTMTALSSKRFSKRLPSGGKAVKVFPFYIIS